MNPLQGPPHFAHSIFLPMLTLFCASLPLHAQSPAPEAGFVQIVNLISLSKPTHFSIGDFALNGGEPILTGDGTGVLALVPGDHPFEIANPAASPQKMRSTLSVENGKTIAVICYAEKGDTDSNGGERFHLRYEILTEGGDSGPHVSLVSLSDEPFIAVELAGESITLTPKRAHRVEVKLGDNLPIALRGQTLTEISVTKAAHYLAFLYPNPETQKLEISVVQNEKLEYQPPRKEMEKEEP